MAVSKNRKDHKKKANARKVRILQEKSKMKKMQNEFITNLIKQEQAKGSFENNSNWPITNDTQGPVIEGPSI